VSLIPTPSQTAGPFVSIGTEWLCGASALPAPPADAVTITGRVLDGQGLPVTDAMLEFWHSGAAGRGPSEPSHSWSGFARALTDADGRYRLATVKPGATGDPAEAPHIDVSVFARGLMQRLVTRIYFADEEVLNSTDPVLLSVPTTERRRSLVARHENGVFAFDIHLQGDDETVFFAPWPE